MAWIYEITVLSRAGGEVTLTSRLDSEQANKLLGTLATLIQQLYRTARDLP